MTNTQNKNEALDDGKHEEGMITQAEFMIFQRETQQALQAIQTTLDRLVTGNNLQHEGEASHKNYRERTRERHPIPRRQLAYEDELSDDKEYFVHMRNMSNTCFDTINKDNAMWESENHKHSTIYSLTEAINLAIKAVAQLDWTRVIIVMRNYFNLTPAATDKGKSPMNQPPPASNLIGPGEETDLAAEEEEDEIVYTYDENEIIRG
ncbi:hypothetical protein POTOM_057851 [Populus tomentosa]|uniref:Uncharacterized protein n=1 Tax=Populus tomentosa TaxID=118781 RepID=A0A8X7XWQ1_POPTO|nr:hypothetical protein POTOM_057851 [Populus tomentosa]